MSIFRVPLMKLFKFPYLVQKEILDHLSLNNIFFLSLCSKRTLFLIRDTQKSRFQTLDQIMFCSGSSIVAISGDKSQIIFKSSKELPKFFKRVTVNVSGTMVDFCSCPTWTTNLLRTDEQKEESTLQAIVDHLYDMIGDSNKFAIMSPASLDIPKLRNVPSTNVVVSSTEEYPFDSQKIYKYLSESPDTQCFSLEVYQDSANFPENSSRNSRIHQLDTVDVYGGGSLPYDILKYFNGRQAFLDTFKMDSSRIVEFLNKWKSGEGFQNLELMSIISSITYFETSDLFSAAILSLVEHKELEIKVFYPIFRKFPSTSLLRHKEIFESQYYLVRESDRRVASLFVEHSDVILGVWNLTEEEFLEKFDKDKKLWKAGK